MVKLKMKTELHRLTGVIYSEFIQENAMRRTTGIYWKKQDEFIFNLYNYITIKSCDLISKRMILAARIGISRYRDVMNTMGLI